MPSYKKEYELLTTVDLLMIAAKREDYPAAAVEAAEALLQQRTVTDEEWELANRMLQQEEDSVEQAIEMRDGRLQFVSTLIKPVPVNVGDAAVAKQVRWFCIVLLAVYAANAVTHFRVVYGALVNGQTLRLQEFLAILCLVYPPVITGMLFQQKRAGWIFVLAEKIFFTLVPLLQIPFLFGYLSKISLVNYWQVAVSFITIIFLMRGRVRRHFNINNGILYNIFVLTAGVAMILVWYMNRNFIPDAKQ